MNRVTFAARAVPVGKTTLLPLARRTMPPVSVNHSRPPTAASRRLVVLVVSEFAST